MTKLTRSDLRTLARVVILANTAPSLYRGLLATPIVPLLRRGTNVAELSAHYDRVTSRAKRTEIELGIAYALLIALLTHEEGTATPDSSRLKWGPAIADLIAKSSATTQSIVITDVKPIATVTQQQNASSGSSLPTPHVGIVLVD
jgi:hypothetical protein